MSGFKKLERPRTGSRRGCGWGSVVTTCARCGKIMLGHNRGLCSKCMRGGACGSIFPERGVGLRHVLLGQAATKRLQAQTMRERYAGGEGAR